MNKSKLWSRVLSVVGIAVMAVRAVASVAYLAFSGLGGFTNLLLSSLLMFPAS